MKLISRIFGVAALLSAASLLDGYAILHNSNSQIPYIDVYVWRADTAQRAKELQDDFARKLNIPEDVIKVLDVANGVSAPVGAALGPATGGASVAVQEGFSTGVNIAKKAYEVAGPQIKDVIGRIYRGKDDAYHADVPRGNRGRFAEWKNPNRMYAIVTLPGSLIPLNAEPALLNPGAVLGVTVTSSPDPANPKNVIYKAVYNYPGAAQTVTKTIAGTKVNLPSGNEYIPAEQDTRNLNTVKELAKTSGAAALQGGQPKG